MRLHTRLVLIISLLTSLLLAPHGATATDRVALVIGNQAYGHATLINTAHDARAMAAMLTQLDFAVETWIDADWAGMVEAISAFAQRLQQARIGLFYYAGHGIQMDGENYLIPAHTVGLTSADVKARTINMHAILDKMGNSGDNKVRLVILDACRDNPFALLPAARKGLADIDAPSGTIIGYATSPGKTAFDGVGNHSPYTKALLQSLQVPGLDLLEIFKRTGNAVAKETRGEQRPWLASSLYHDVYLRPIGLSPANAPLSATGIPGKKAPLSEPTDRKAATGQTPERCTDLLVDMSLGKLLKKEEIEFAVAHCPR